MGDKPGHKFRGNQWSGGRNASKGGGRGGLVKPGSRGVLDKAASEYPPARAGEPETLDRFTDENGNLTPERQALHDALVDQAFEGKTPVDNPQATVLGGGPASGKSSMEEAGMIDPTDPNTVMVDVDKVRVQMPEYKEQFKGNPDVSAAVHEESSSIAKRIVARANAEGYNVHVDGTGDSDYNKLEKKMNDHRNSGHKVVAQYATLDVELAVTIAKDRQKKTGRKVPESYLRETHKNVSRVLPRAIKNGLFDEVTLFDNNIHKKPRKVLTHKNGKTTIHNQKLYDDFLAKGD